MSYISLLCIEIQTPHIGRNYFFHIAGVDSRAPDIDLWLIFILPAWIESERNLGIL